MSRPHDVTDRELEVLRKFENCEHENIVKVIAMEEQVIFAPLHLSLHLCRLSLHLIRHLK